MSWYDKDSITCYRCWQRFSTPIDKHNHQRDGCKGPRVDPKAKVGQRWGQLRFIKRGTWAGSVAAVRPDLARGSSSLCVGARVQFREGRGHGDKWQDAIVREMGPAPEYRLFLEMM